MENEADAPDRPQGRRPIDPAKASSGRSLALSLSVFAFAVGASGLAAGENDQDDGLLAKVADYVEGYEKQFSNVVAEEHYSQESRDPADDTLLKQRELLSDFLFVQLPHGAGWRGFRDVYEVDGKHVHDRSDRLYQLFVKSRPKAVDQAQAIAHESTRFNLGFTRRDFNIPTFAMGFLEANTQPRFLFYKVGHRVQNGTPGLVLSYVEHKRPTIIQLEGYGDLPASGTFVVDPTTGAVLLTELHLSYEAGPGGSAHVSVTYGLNPEVPFLVPVSMTEVYNTGPGAIGVRDTPGQGEHLTGEATYSNFRGFQVTTKEELRIPVVPPQ